MRSRTGGLLHWLVSWQVVFFPVAILTFYLNYVVVSSGEWVVVRAGGVSNWLEMLRFLRSDFFHCALRRANSHELGLPSLTPILRLASPVDSGAGLGCIAFNIITSGYS